MIPLFFSFFFSPLLLSLSGLFPSSLMSSNSSSCTIPTTEEVAIQAPSDGAEERAIVWAGSYLLIGKEKIAGIDSHTG